MPKVAHLGSFAERSVVLWHEEMIFARPTLMNYRKRWERTQAGSWRQNGGHRSAASAEWKATTAKSLGGRSYVRRQFMTGTRKRGRARKKVYLRRKVAERVMISDVRLAAQRLLLRRSDCRCPGNKLGLCGQRLQLSVAILNRHTRQMKRRYCNAAVVSPIHTNIYVWTFAMQGRVSLSILMYVMYPYYFAWIVYVVCLNCMFVLSTLRLTKF